MFKVSYDMFKLVAVHEHILIVVKNCMKNYLLNHNNLVQVDTRHKIL